MRVIFLTPGAKEQQRELPDGCESFDVENGHGRVRYTKKTWRTPSSASEVQAESVYFVPSSIDAGQQESLIREYRAKMDY